MTRVATLRLWLAGPLQAWGTASRFEVRATDLWPSKSGVIGLLGAALGRGRTAGFDDLAALRFGVRVVRGGSVMRDFHTAGAAAGSRGVVVSSGAGNRGIVSTRYYLQDAAFVCGLEGDDRSLLDSLVEAVRSPCWPLALGRRSCPPAGPVVDPFSVFDGDLTSALRDDWQPACAGPAEGDPDALLVLEDPAGPEVRADQPVAAAFRTREFAARRMRVVPLASLGDASA